MVYCIKYSHNWIIGAITIVAGVFIFFEICVVYYHDKLKTIEIIISTCNILLAIWCIPLLFYTYEMKVRKYTYLKWCKVEVIFVIPIERKEIRKILQHGSYWSHNNKKYPYRIYESNGTQVTWL